VGDRLGHIRAGVSFLRSIFRPGLRVSSVYETAPVDCPPGSENFYNAVAEGDFDGNARDLLLLLKGFEATRGTRPMPAVRNTPRALDLDLLYTEKELRQEDLVLPHPRMLQRRFVIEPLSEIRPELVLPGQKKTIAELLAGLQGGAKVERIGAIPG
jgi:2-amino-4-hydroxy-6-hydroxymethyldihydropteridine diphosphokinase